MHVAFIVLRAIHILCAVCWAGGALFMGFVMLPGVNVLGAEGGRFMRGLMQMGRLPRFMAINGSLTWLSGLVLYWQVSNGLKMAWLFSVPGIILTLGALAGIIAMFVGAKLLPTASRQLAAAHIESAGSQSEGLTAAQAHLHRIETLHLPLLILAVLAMALWAYL